MCFHSCSHGVCALPRLHIPSLYSPAASPWPPPFDASSLFLRPSSVGRKKKRTEKNPQKKLSICERIQFPPALALRRSEHRHLLPPPLLAFALSVTINTHKHRKKGGKKRSSVSISSSCRSSSFITPTPFTSSPTSFRFIRYNKHTQTPTIHTNKPSNFDQRLK